MTAVEFALSSRPSSPPDPQCEPCHRAQSSHTRPKRHLRGSISRMVHLQSARKSAREQLALNPLHHAVGEDSQGATPINGHESTSCISSVLEGCLRLMQNAGSFIARAILPKRRISRHEYARGSNTPPHLDSCEEAKVPGISSHVSPKLPSNTKAQCLDKGPDDHRTPDMSRLHEMGPISHFIHAPVRRRIEQIESLLSSDSGEVQDGVSDAPTLLIKGCVEKEVSPSTKATAGQGELSATWMTRTARENDPAIELGDQPGATNDPCGSCSSDNAERKRLIMKAAVCPEHSGPWTHVMVMFDSGSPWSLISESTILKHNCLKNAFQKDRLPRGAPPEIEAGGGTFKVLGHLSKLVLRHQYQYYEVKKVFVIEDDACQHANVVVGLDSMPDDKALLACMLRMLKPVMPGVIESR